jgi:hypothetical protein
MPDLNEIAEDLSRTARDAAYVAVGLGVLAVQRAQVRRQELAKHLAEPRAQVETTIDEVRGELSRRAKDVDDRVEKLITLLEGRWEPVEGRLPGQARIVIQQARSQAREARQQIRTLLPTA